MRKRIALFVALGIVLTATVALAVTDWKLAGAWNYTLSVPSATVGGNPASLTETGILTMKMTENGGVEYFKSYDQSYSGILTVSGNKQTYSGSFKDEALEPTAYTPGNSYIVKSTQNISGTTVTATYTLTQTEENKVTGTAVIKYGAETANGTITATRPSADNGGGGCSVGFGALALLALTPLFFRKKR
ncbi:MAG: Synerg-CTERM sorting domain-containing protein [Synergistaceae bacterium]|nr:Synerg-CTERM sorting domain-containing protein [Synergistaceae bacterium]